MRAGGAGGFLAASCPPLLRGRAPARLAPAPAGARGMRRRAGGILQTSSTVGPSHKSSRPLWSYQQTSLVPQINKLQAELI